MKRLALGFVLVVGFFECLGAIALAYWLIWKYYYHQ